MLRRFLVFIAIISLFFSGCIKPLTTQAQLNNEFTLAIGQIERITGENLTIKFIDVTGDSRCAQGVECFQAGSVSCLVEFNKSGTFSRMTLQATGGIENYSTAAYSEYQLKFRVTPYPKAGATINKSEYRLILTVSINS